MRTSGLDFLLKHVIVLCVVRVVPLGSKFVVAYLGWRPLLRKPREGRDRSVSSSVAVMTRYFPEGTLLATVVDPE